MRLEKFLKVGEENDDDNDEEEDRREFFPNLYHLISYKDRKTLNKIIRYQGDKVRLFCLDYSFRADGILKWNKNDVFYSLKIDKQAHINKYKEFVIEKLDFKHAGTYECLFDEKVVLEIELKVIPLFLKEDKYEDYFEDDENQHLFEVFKQITVIFVCILIAKSINSVVKNSNTKKRDDSNNSDLVRFNNFI